MTQDSQTLTFAAPLIPNYTLNGFGTLKWNGSQYEFEGDPHESAKIFAEHLLVRVNAKPDSQTLTADYVPVLRDDLETAWHWGDALQGEYTFNGEELAILNRLRAAIGERG